MYSSSKKGFGEGRGHRVLEQLDKMNYFCNTRLLRFLGSRSKRETYSGSHGLGVIPEAGFAPFVPGPLIRSFL